MSNPHDGPHEEDDTAGRLRIVPLSEVAAEPIRWLWPGYLPLGKLVLLEGHPRLGKSAVALDLAARLSAGLAMPDNSSAGDPADTLVLSYEDSAADTLRPRVEAAGGDPSRIHHVIGASAAGKETIIPASLPTDIDALERALAKRPAVRLLLIDPLVAAIAATVDVNRDQGIRFVLGRIAAIAASHDITVVAIRHLRKSRGGPAIAAGSGSIGIVGVARGSLLVARDPDAEDASILASVKMNLAAAPASLGFRKQSAMVSSSTGTDVPTMRLEWTGTRELSADQLVDAAPLDSGAGREADRWLTTALADGPKERGALLLAANAEGLGSRRVQRAAARLRVRQTREGQGERHRSLWALPR